MEGEGNEGGLEVSWPWVWVASCQLESPRSWAVMTPWEQGARLGGDGT